MSSEEIAARKKAMKQDYPQIYDRVTAILFEEDPIGINYEFNTDEYEPETGSILPRIGSCRSAEELQRVVHEEFVRWFGAVTAGPFERYTRIAARIWREPGLPGTGGTTA